MPRLDVIRRLSFAIEYLTHNEDIPKIRAAFIRENVFDVFGCTYLSLWTIDDEGHWKEVASDGDPSPFELSPKDWTQLNREVVVRRHPGDSEVNSGSLWSQPFTFNGNIYVVHVAHAASDPELVETLVGITMRLLYALKAASPRSIRLAKAGEMTHRQEQILRLMSEGRTYAQIARDLGYSESLVKQEAGQICKLLGAKSRFEAVELFTRKSINN